VDDVRQPVGGLILHVGTVLKGTVIEGDRAQATVDVSRRWDIMRNHTATHLLHASLRKELGEHVRQKGSLVAPDRLRFDFSHNSALTPEEIDRITAGVNEMILANRPVQIAFKPLEEARREGAMALFGEKYGATVRTLTIPQPASDQDRFSYELCGGTHVRSTAEIGPFLITAQGSSGAGVRRVEAITGRGAQRALQSQIATLKALAQQLKTEPDDLLPKVTSLLEELNSAYRAIDKLQRQTAKNALETLLASAREVDGIKLVAGLVQATDADLLGEMADWCRDRLRSGVVVLGSDIGGMPRLVAKVTPDVVARGVHAGKLVGQIAKMVGGGGGGRPDFATAGGKDTGKLAEAVGAAEQLIADALK
jgi:alanyl-tRNA synthetase